MVRVVADPIEEAIEVQIDGSREPCDNVALSALHRLADELGVLHHLAEGLAVGGDGRARRAGRGQERAAILLALDEALSNLAADEPAKAELVKLRFFAGLTMPEAASALGISLATAERYWTFARSWLYAEMSDHHAHAP